MDDILDQLIHAIKRVAEVHLEDQRASMERWRNEVTDIIYRAWGKIGSLRSRLENVQQRYDAYAKAHPGCPKTGVCAGCPHASIMKEGDHVP